MGWKGEVIGKRDITAGVGAKVGFSAPGILSKLLNVDVNAMARYGITKSNAEKVLADLNYALVSKAWHEAWQAAHINNKFDENTFREEFHQNLSELYTRYESWAAGRRDDQYGADHLIGDIRDALSFMKGESKKLLSGVLDGLGDSVKDASKGTRKVTNDVLEGFNMAP